MALSNEQLAAFQTQISKINTGSAGVSSSRVVTSQQINQVLKAPKRVTPTAPIAKITQAPQPPSLIAKAQETTRSIGDFVLKLITPTKIISPVPQETLKQNYPTATPQKIILSADQKKLTPEQMSQVQLKPSILKPAPQQNIWDKITQKISDLFDSPESQKARAMNAVAVEKNIQSGKIDRAKLEQTIGRKVTLTGLAEKGGNPLKNSLMEDVTKELGIRNQGTTSEIGQAIFTMAMGTGLIEAPVAVVSGLGIFTAVNEVKSGFISAVKGEGFKLGANQTFSDLFPDAPGDVKNLLDLGDFLFTAKASKDIYDVSPKVFEVMTKDIITKYNLPKTVTIDAKVLTDLRNSGKIVDAELKDALKIAGLSGKEQADIIRGVKPAIDVQIPSQKVVTMADKPYWQKIKSIFKVAPTEPSSVTYMNGKEGTRQAVKGLLPPGEYTPQEVIGKVVSNNLEKTPEGKEMLKTAAEAQKSGQNIFVEEKKVEVNPSNTDPLIEEAKKYKSAEEFARSKINAYHGTNEKFETFDLKKTGLNTGNKYDGKGAIFFTTDKDIAQTYANADKLMAKRYNLNPRVIEAYVELKNPLVIDAKGKDFGATHEKAIIQARKNGNDGVIIKNVLDTNSGKVNKPTEIRIAFSNDQIKTKNDLINIFNGSAKGTKGDIENLKPTLDKKLAEINKKMGKDMSPEEQKLIEEARKYKSSEEFIKNITKKDYGDLITQSSDLRFGPVDQKDIVQESIDLPFGIKGYIYRDGDLFRVVEKSTGSVVGTGSRLTRTDSAGIKQAIDEANKAIKNEGEVNIKKQMASARKAPLNGFYRYWNRIPDETLTSLWDRSQSLDEPVKSEINYRSDIEKQSFDDLRTNPVKKIDEYIKTYKNVASTDEAVKMFAGYNGDNYLDFQKPASLLRNLVFEKLLNDNQGKGNNTVLITAGSPGAGKTSALSNVIPKDELQKHPAVLDTTLANKNTPEEIQKVLDKGYKVRIAYVYTDPVEAWRRVLERVITEGRTLQEGYSLNVFDKARNQVINLYDKFKNEPDKVDFRFIDNTGPEGTAKLATIETVKNFAYNREEALQAIQQLTDDYYYRDGKLTERQYKALTADRSQRLGTNAGQQSKQEGASGQKEKAGEELRSDQKPVGSGKLRESKAYSRIKDRLAEELREDVSYNQYNRDEQAMMAVDFIENNPEKALRVAFGLEAPPPGLLDRAVNLALAEQARLEGNDKLYTQLESSGSYRQTRHGQETSYDRGRFNNDHPHKYIKELLDRRLEIVGNSSKAKIVAGFEKIMKSAKQKAVDLIDTKVKELQNKLKRRDRKKIDLAQNIIDSLTCK